MAKNRDDFSRATIEVMGKRVGYICSNPTCKQLTIGANEIDTKSTSIGIASHITAASSGGPRFDESLTTEQRSHINNGIWLCSNCAKLIDTDIDKFPTGILKNWKQNAEKETLQKLNGKFKNQSLDSPFLEIDLICLSNGRWNIDYSDKNPIELFQGRQTIIIEHKPIIHWELYWHFNFVIYNNSKFAAYNVQIESKGAVHFSHIDRLPKKNNLPPLQNIDLNAKYEDYVEGDYTVAEEKTKSKIPIKFNELTLQIKYLDDNRKEHVTYVEFKNGEIINRKE